MDRNGPKRTYENTETDSRNTETGLNKGMVWQGRSGPFRYRVYVQVYM